MRNNILSKDTIGNFRGNAFVIGTTLKNKYYPVYIIDEEYEKRVSFSNAYEQTLHQKIINDILIYKKPLFNRSILEDDTNFNYVGFFRRLRSTVKLCKFKFKFNQEDYNICVMRGYLTDDWNNILLCLCTKSHNIFNEKGELITSNLKLFISNELINNSIYKNVFKMLNKEYIDFFYKNDIDVVFTTSKKIQNRIFGNHFKLEFKNINELNNHLKTEVKHLLNFDEKK